MNGAKVLLLMTALTCAGTRGVPPATRSADRAGRRGAGLRGARPMMRALVTAVVVVCGACGEARSRPAAPGGETAACRASRREILAAAETSRAQACAIDDDCAEVTNPGHPSEEVRLVVHAPDAALLERRAGNHLARCGAYLHLEALDAFVVVAAVCTAGRCAARETTQDSPGLSTTVPPEAAARSARCVRERRDLRALDRRRLRGARDRRIRVSNAIGAGA